MLVWWMEGIPTEIWFCLAQTPNWSFACTSINGVACYNSIQQRRIRIYLSGSRHQKICNWYSVLCKAPWICIKVLAWSSLTNSISVPPQNIFGADRNGKVVDTWKVGSMIKKNTRRWSNSSRIQHELPAYRS